MSLKRLDRRLRGQHPDLSWLRIRKAIERGQVTVDGVTSRDPGLAIEDDAIVEFDPARRALPHARLDLPRLYEDDDILVVDKPEGLLTLASRAETREIEDTVLARAKAYATHLHGRAGYAGLLHRLDRGTSGALAIALTRRAHRLGRAMFGTHAFERHYLALVHGVPSLPRGTVDAKISNAYRSGRRAIVQEHQAGRRAVTRYVVREAFEEGALLELELETGRQHQIRLHLQRLGHPLIGEQVYVAGATRAGAPDTRGGPGSRRLHARRPLLHAWRLAFPHPLSGKPIRVEAPLPADFAELLDQLRRSAKRTTGLSGRGVD
ncbi:MAG: RluA family pseudouridine synthase [Acidobacteriota bacterium]